MKVATHIINDDEVKRQEQSRGE